MRTTLNLDDDVLSAVKDRARREGRSIGEVISDLARQALTGPMPGRSGEETHGFFPVPSRGPLVSNAVIDGLREDEAE
ncbi:ribbon-helix-helix domain-containing protein [soil metagenome]